MEYKKRKPDSRLLPTVLIDNEGDEDETEVSHDIGILIVEVCSIDVWNKVSPKRCYMSEIMYRLRVSYIQRFGFAVLTTEVRSFLVQFLQKLTVLEVGCGTGYLSKELEKFGISITAIDQFTSQYDLCLGDNCSETFERYNVKVDHIVDAVSFDKEQYDAVIMSWPDYDSSFALLIAQSMFSGQILIYQGEGRGGCTANNEFFEYLNSSFALQKKETVEINFGHFQFPGIHDSWEIHIKH